MESDRPKRVLALIASPRILGNCEVFTKEISRHIPEEHSLRLIRLTSLRIGPCRACYGCVMGKECPIEDDMSFLLNEIADADAVIVASPVYYLGANAIIKSILDRGFLFFNVLERTYGTPTILLDFYGIPERIGMAPQMLEVFRHVPGAFRQGEPLHRGGPSRRVADEQAERFPGPPFGKGPFLFPETEKGTGLSFLRLRDRPPHPGRFHLYRMPRQLYRQCERCLRQEERGRHHGAAGTYAAPPRMARGMKKRFQERKKEILRTIVPYRDEGEWIEPPG